jgi:hypothetical protein
LDWGLHNDNKSLRIQITFTPKNNPQSRAEIHIFIITADERMGPADERPIVPDK